MARRAPGEQDRETEVQGGSVHFFKVTLALWAYEDLQKISETLKYLLATKWEKKTAKSKLINVKCLQM